MIYSYESHRQKLIINADDFGVSPRANRNILFLASLGKIDRVGVMVHGKISPKEIDELYRSEVKIDIHLDILHQFHEDRKHRQSAIIRGLEFLLKIITGKISPSKVEAQWREQIIKFQEIFGKAPDGINSHEHVHFFPPFFKIATKLADEFSIPYMRFGESEIQRHNNLIGVILHYLRLFDLKVFGKSDCVSSQSLVSLDWISNIDDFLNNLPEGTIEIACHPELAEDFVKIKKFF